VIEMPRFTIPHSFNFIPIRTRSIAALRETSGEI
jgi:hypothetical protein